MNINTVSDYPLFANSVQLQNSYYISDINYGHTVHECMYMYIVWNKLQLLLLL